MPAPGLSPSLSLSKAHPWPPPLSPSSPNWDPEQPEPPPPHKSRWVCFDWVPGRHRIGSTLTRPFLIGHWSVYGWAHPGQVSIPGPISGGEEGPPGACSSPRGLCSGQRQPPPHLLGFVLRTCCLTTSLGGVSGGDLEGPGMKVKV